MRSSWLFLCVIGFYSLVQTAQATPVGAAFTYEGKGAGQVVFDGTVHATKGLTCSTCHEGRGLFPPLFEMKRNAGLVSMRKIEMGTSCGYCHHVTMNDMSSCSFCHKK